MQIRYRYLDIDGKKEETLWSGQRCSGRLFFYVAMRGLALAVCGVEGEEREGKGKGRKSGMSHVTCASIRYQGCRWQRLRGSAYVAAGGQAGRQAVTQTYHIGPPPSLHYYMQHTLEV